jgi:hypothetical protein
MKQFKNFFLTFSGSANVNFLKLAYIRRGKLIEEGYNVNNVNWDHYAKVLEAKAQIIQAS